MPRSTPAADPEQFACCSRSGAPTASSNAEDLNHSRNTPRSSPNCFGVNSHAPAMASSRICIRTSLPVAARYGVASQAPLLVEQLQQIAAVARLRQLLRALTKLVVADEAA